VHADLLAGEEQPFDQRARRPIKRVVDARARRAEPQDLRQLQAERAQRPLVRIWCSSPSSPPCRVVDCAFHQLRAVRLEPISAAARRALSAAQLRAEAQCSRVKVVRAVSERWRSDARSFA
jgi:hypothetical protein